MSDSELYQRAKLDWCNLTKYNSVVTKRLEATSKNILVVALERTPSFDDAKSACESLCGRLYFPSTFIENEEVEDFLYDQDSIGHRDIWLRPGLLSTTSSTTSSEVRDISTVRGRTRSPGLD